MQSENNFHPSEQEKKRIDEMIREKTVSYILAAFGLVAGLAWNEAIKALIEYVFPANSNSIIVKFFYAIVLTITLVLVSVYLSKILKKEEKQ
jgi:hypothetical protein